MDGWSQYSKMLKDYSEGSGSAMEEAEKSASNWTGLLNRLSNSWTKLVSNFADSETITKAIQTLSKFVDVADNLTEAFGKINSSLGGGSSLGGTIGILTGLIQSLTGHGEIVLRPSL